MFIISMMSGCPLRDTQTIPFHPTDRKFFDAYFKILNHPLEEEGVDFWWLDWQQGEFTR